MAKINVSVLIPTYNSEDTITHTLTSVLNQSLSPYEIIIIDDGSSDNTLNVLSQYRSKITIVKQHNKGVANARNKLCQMAKGEILALLDHDDVWHPDYLAEQSRFLRKYKNVCASFVRHVNFKGIDEFKWENLSLSDQKSEYEIIDPINFLKLYNRLSGVFVSPSMMCVQRWVLCKIGKNPFYELASGADDVYFCNRLAMVGPIGLIKKQLLAYRLLEKTQSTDILRCCERSVLAFEGLKKSYEGFHDVALRRQFEIEYSSRRRQYFKRLMGVKKKREARLQLKQAFRDCNDLMSRMKTILLFFVSYMPKIFSPKWPPRFRIIDF